MFYFLADILPEKRMLFRNTSSKSFPYKIIFPKIHGVRENKVSMYQL